MIPLFNGRIKRVHIKMKYDAKHRGKKKSRIRNAESRMAGLASAKFWILTPEF
jgi:hypothetical protein